MISRLQILSVLVVPRVSLTDDDKMTQPLLVLLEPKSVSDVLFTRASIWGGGYRGSCQQLQTVRCVRRTLRTRGFQAVWLRAAQLAWHPPLWPSHTCSSSPRRSLAHLNQRAEGTLRPTWRSKKQKQKTNPDLRKDLTTFSLYWPNTQYIDARVPYRL